MCSLATVLGRVVELCQGMREHHLCLVLATPLGLRMPGLPSDMLGPLRPLGRSASCARARVAYLWRLRGGRSSSVLGSL